MQLKYKYVLLIAENYVTLQHLKQLQRKVI